jgi:Stigma-specific protein, Stig1
MTTPGFVAEYGLRKPSRRYYTAAPRLTCKEGQQKCCSTDNETLAQCNFALKICTEECHSDDTIQSGLRCIADCQADYNTCVTPSCSCADLSNDAANCGSCHKVCPSSAPVCSMGICQPAGQSTGCTPGQPGCGDTCPPNLTDCKYCTGSESVAYYARCIMGYHECMVVCETCGGPDDLYCDRDLCHARCEQSREACLATKCPICKNLGGDPVNCGSCHHVCLVPANAAATCNNGECGFECNPPFSKCGEVCVDFENDPDNCGGCGVGCPLGSKCCNGVCTSVRTDINNCGSCGNVCENEGEICIDGACTCSPGLESCGGQCTDVFTDSSNCGSCGAACDTSGINSPCKQQCVGGRCVCQGTGACSKGQTNCSGTCVDTVTDPGNCGHCGISCGESETCQNGKCAKAGCSVSLPYACGPGCCNLPWNCLCDANGSNCICCENGICANDTNSYCADSQGNCGL